LERALGHFWNEIKLVEIYFVPGNRRIFFETGFALLAEVIHRCINILEPAARGILDNFWPGFIGFTESYSVGMARAAVSTEGFVGFFRDVRSAHHHRHANGADCIGHAVGLGDHAGHRADPDKSDILFAHKTGDAGFIHRLRVAVNQHYFVAVWSQRLEQEHPKMGHEITSDPVVGVVQQNAHVLFSI